MNIAINGFGRIGRQALRIILDNHPEMNVVLINDLSPNDMLSHLFKFDSVYRQYQGEVAATDSELNVNGTKIKMTEEKDPASLPHKKLGVDVVLECTGVFRKREGASLHLKGGAKKVILSAPAKDEIDGTFVLGVNDDELTADMEIISNASCTTNCLAPMVKVLHDSFGIQQGFMTTIHSYTSSQHLVDGPNPKDWRRARAAAVNVIPTTTGAAKTVGLVLPELAGKLDGMAVRVPTPSGSLSDLTCVLEKEATAEQVNAAFKKAAEGPMKGVLQFEERPIVLQDIIGNCLSSIVDAQYTSTTTTDGATLLKCLAWYDNEWGYSCRLVELAKLVGEKCGY